MKKLKRKIWGLLHPQKEYYVTGTFYDTEKKERMFCRVVFHSRRGVLPIHDIEKKLEESYGFKVVVLSWWEMPAGMAEYVDKPLIKGGL